MRLAGSLLSSSVLVVAMAGACRSGFESVDLRAGVGGVAAGASGTAAGGRGGSSAGTTSGRGGTASRGGADGGAVNEGGAPATGGAVNAGGTTDAGGAPDDAGAANGGSLPTGGSDAGTGNEGGAPDAGGSTGNGGSAGSGVGGAAGGGTAGIDSGGSTGSGGVSAGSSGAGGSSAGGASAGGAGGAGAGGTSAGSAGTATGGAAGGPTLPGCQTTGFNAKTYVVCPARLSWNAARTSCSSIQMDLVRVNDSAEDQWLFDNAQSVTPPIDSLWIGAHETLLEGAWNWTDGTLFWLGGLLGFPQAQLYTNWQFGEPSGLLEDCGALAVGTPGATWYSDLCTLQTKSYVCEAP
jgi:hypothetical protein